jgi:hypothetical protein
MKRSRKTQTLTAKAQEVERTWAHMRDGSWKLLSEVDVPELPKPYDLALARRRDEAERAQQTQTKHLNRRQRGAAEARDVKALNTEEKHRRLAKFMQKHPELATAERVRRKLQSDSSARKEVLGEGVPPAKVPSARTIQRAAERMRDK